MVFETVQRVPDSVLKGEEGARYLEKGDLEGLTAHSLLYFLKRSRYHRLEDYPCMGAFERRHQFSTVEGPFESVPEIKEPDNDYSESTKEVLKLLVPVGLIPIFEKVSLVEYGTQTDLASLQHIGLVAGERIKPEEMMKIGEKVLANLRGKCDLQQLSDSSYRALIHDSLLLEFCLSLGRPYPLIEMTLFGKEGIPQQFFQESGMWEVGEQFPVLDRKVGMVNSRRKGLAYDLTLNGEEISEIIDRENVLV